MRQRAKDFAQVTDPILLEAMRMAAAEDFPIIIHAENEAINQYYTKKYKGSSRWEDLGRMRPEVSEMEQWQNVPYLPGLQEPECI